MKIHSLICCLVVIVVAFSSCSDDESDGAWDDNIQLSVKSVSFTSAADSVIITTKGDWWWVTDVTVGEDVFYMPDGVDVESTDYAIRQNSFVVERRGKNALFVKVDALVSSQPRLITIGLEAADYFDRISISQSPPKE